MEKVLKKIVPILYLLILYVYPVAIYIGDINFSDAVYVIALAIVGTINVIYSFWLFKQKDEGNLKFGMMLLTAGLIPYFMIMSILVILLLSMVAAAAGAGISEMMPAISMVILILMLIIWGGAFYQFNYAKMYNTPVFYKVATFFPIINAISSMMLLVKMSKEEFERIV